MEPLSLWGVDVREGSTRTHVNVLVQRCVAGDGAAWAEVVHRYERLVYSIPIRSGLSEDDSSDVVQSVFGALLAQIGHIREPERLAYWLMTVARRMTWRRLDLLRVERSADLMHTTDVAAPGAVDSMDQLVEEAAMIDAVELLEEPCRSLLIALFLDPNEPSYEEIADLLGRPIGSVGPSRQRCLQKLAQLLDVPA